MSFAKVEKMFVFVTTDAKGEEGICAVRRGDTWFPLICSQLDLLEQLRPMAEQIAKQNKSARITLLQFSDRKALETIQGVDGWQAT
jgi:predicted pyridoxine 5'-phosphate oxidase superfamily flavin-nucleotide-binding protein